VHLYCCLQIVVAILLLDSDFQSAYMEQRAASLIKISFGCCQFDNGNKFTNILGSLPYLNYVCKQII
jgi:hypothetical protein